MIITPKEYAHKNGITLQAVTKRLRSNKSLLGVSEVKKMGRFYILKVKNDYLQSNKSG